ncbi:hypothetical protein EV356DRAFT_507462, partial [Viridothelium virens]
MYPDEFHFNNKTQEITYTTLSHATLQLRLSSSYPNSSSLPDLISVTGAPPQKVDLRNQYRLALQSIHLSPNEPVLDSMLTTFNDLLESTSTSITTPNPDVPSPTTAHPTSPPHTSSSPTTPSPTLTVIIWLHHLLATSKRKLALHPASSSIAGLTKPGYPGVMVFSGPRDDVEAHVAALKAQRWQAWQVRYEEVEEDGAGSEGAWAFGHGEGVREVEGMGEVVAGIEGEGRRRVFLGAMGM